MFGKTIGNFHAGSKVAGREYLPSLFFALVLAFVFSVYPSKAQAQIVGDLEVNIPFQFHAGNSKLPAGEYLIHFLNDSDLAVMEISSVDGSTATLFQVQNIDAKAAPAKNELIFNKYGNRYFLAQLFEEGSSIGSQVLESDYEKKVSQQTAEGQEHVPARRREQGK
jgi:hypothetical protein